MTFGFLNVSNTTCKYKHITEFSIETICLDIAFVSLCKYWMEYLYEYSCFLDFKFDSYNITDQIGF